MSQKMKVTIHNHSRHAPVRCLNCGATNDAATCISTEDGDPSQPMMPEPGNIIVCASCKHIMQWADGGGFEELSDETAREVAGHPLLVKLLAKKP